MEHLSIKNVFNSFYVSLNVLYYILEITLIVIAIMIQYDDNITSTICNICYIISILIIMYILRDLTIQLCNLLNKNLKLNGIQLLEMSLKYKIAIGICIIFITLQTIDDGFSYIWRYNNISFICLYYFVIILFKIPVSSQQNLNTNVINMNGLDYGTGMAYNYYYGYLRIILPSTGTENKGIYEKLENFEDIHNIIISIKKLFILIPFSTYIPPDLKQLSYEWMENVQELEQEVRNRAGIKNRSYHNNIYKIYPGGDTNSIEPVYLAVEGATPLLTFFEVQKHFHPESAIYIKYSRQIIEAFYLKLKELIYNDLDCRDLCELIYYEDYNSDGTKVNIAEVILKRISILKDSEYTNHTD
ncbi:stimulator of interferon genes protein isoform X1 [Vespa crabro]|uniref:stimulator of interferon genes protein isoform X1 n=2 Tax=Vespa crabro TaxID=7445 RepID=UPI001EFFFE6D|nr:stimulator of interferon genes protein isoform X1 [Vespa crabro]XP_046820306.1 stimulator of interferon genes protein isoform X1 [Vespa crabro]